MKWIVAILCIPIGAFCVFGFLATFEPGAGNALAFRLVYGAGLVVCVVVVASVIGRSILKDRR